MMVLLYLEDKLLNMKMAHFTTGNGNLFKFNIKRDHKENQRHGRGIYITNEINYEGYFRFDKMSIYGQMLYRNGNIYIGK
jgi:hypothetical protein